VPFNSLGAASTFKKKSFLAGVLKELGRFEIKSPPNNTEIRYLNALHDSLSSRATKPPGGSSQSVAFQTISEKAVFRIIAVLALWARFIL